MRLSTPAPSAHTLRKTHLVLLICWLLMVPVSVVFGLLSSVEFIAAASIYANSVGHWSAWQGSRAEEEAE